MPQLAPATLAELTDAVRSTPHLLAVGARTKPRLSHTSDDVLLISMRGLSGIVEYDPGEFTFTARAGTPVREISAALAAEGQYLPFDPMLVDAGATLGGTVAAGLSGPGRFRFGGIRDFILGIHFVDGSGRLLRMGGKVVKNAAGFDLPKFFVGSLGRFGVLAEITFKVFPRTAASLTLRLILDDVEAAARVLAEAANTRWEPDALDLLPDGQSLLLRLATPEPAATTIAREILGRWPGEALASDEAARVWTLIREFQWASPELSLVKVSTTAAQIPRLHHAVNLIPGTRIHVSAGGDVAYLSAPESAALDRTLRELHLRGLRLRGSGPLWSGHRPEMNIEHGVKSALDPSGRFPPLE